MDDTKVSVRSQFYHINLPTPSLSWNRNTYIVTKLIAAYHTPSRITLHIGASTSCTRASTYGMRKYRGSRRGVGRRVISAQAGRRMVWRSDWLVPG